MRQMMISLLAVMTLFGCASGHNVPLPYPIADALARPEYKDKLNGVAFYFGDQSHPAIEKSFGVKTTAQRSNATGDRGFEESCDRAFVSALLRLRSAALRAGGNAVIDIKSNYKHNEVSSTTHYQCATGALMSGVALKGMVVKLKKL